ncbi:hypothetical protein AAD018_011165 [Aestuariibius insulae]|uniref:hypothetical protein n=1 Tax=Aestuariibius insulae TaxID=2058287 RepID=UPI00345E52ED
MIRSVFSRLSRGASAVAHAQSRSAEFERLNAKSDAELARIGLSRGSIARYVYRDILYV